MRRAALLFGSAVLGMVDACSSQHRVPGAVASVDKRDDHAVLMPAVHDLHEDANGERRRC